MTRGLRLRYDLPMIQDLCTRKDLRASLYVALVKSPPRTITGKCLRKAPDIHLTSLLIPEENKRDLNPTVSILMVQDQWRAESGNVGFFEAISWGLLTYIG